MKVLEPPTKETGLYKTLMRDVVVVDGGPRHLFTVARGIGSCELSVRRPLGSRSMAFRHGFNPPASLAEVR